MDQSKIDVSSQSQQEQVYQNLSQLRKDVQLSPTKLREITNTNEFIERVIQLNNNAKQSIQINRMREALIYLGEAERILQHAANYGKTIQRNLIIHILHNQACCHQKTYQLSKCSGYLQALIYNYNSHLKNSQSTSEHVQNRKSKELVTIENIEKKNQLAKYYLQFQVVNSQQQNHSGALIAGRKAIEILKSNFREIFITAKKLKKSPYEKKFDIELRTKIIDNISRLNDSFSFSDSKFMLSAALCFLKSWTQHLSSNSKQKDRNFVLQQQFKHYSIGNPLNLIPMQYQQSRDQRQKNFSAKNILQKLLTLGICYFTIATELRYISNQKHPQNQPAKRSSSQFKQSQLYHLLSVILISYFVPFDILLMKHITSSFETHYKLNLFQMVSKLGKNQLQNYGSEKQTEKYQAFLFPEANRISQSNSSILVSGIGENAPGCDLEKTDANLTRAHSGGGTSQTIKRNQHVSDESINCHNKQDQFTLKNLAGNSHKIHLSPKTYNKILTEPNSSRKLKQTPNKKPSKSKSKAKLLMNNLTGLNFKKQSQTPIPDRYPMPKSPKTHTLNCTSNSKDLKDSRGIVKIKTTHRLKISTEKIEYRKQGEKQKDRKSPVMNFDYFTNKSKDLRKSINAKNTNSIQSPKIQNTSRSSSRKQSPVPNYFQPMVLKSGRKTIKSPRPQKQQNPYVQTKIKQKKKGKKMSFQQYYL